MSSARCLFIFDELPFGGFAGHTTYNSAYVESLVRQGFKVAFLVVGCNSRRLTFDAMDTFGIEGASINFGYGGYFIGNKFVPSPQLVVRTLLKRLFNFAKRFLLKKHPGFVHIGKHAGPLTPSQVDFVKYFDPNTLFVDTIFRSGVLHDLKFLKAKNVLIAHDVFFLRCESIIRSGLKPAPVVTAEKEASIFRLFDEVITITEDDCKTVKSLVDVNTSFLYSPVSLPSDLSPRFETLRVFYMGSSAQINVDGLQWFLKEVWPLVRLRVPAAILDVVGSICERVPGKTDGVVFHGRLEDFSSVADGCMFAINPVRSGSGLKIKVLDYFSQGLGVVTTPCGFSGFPVKNLSPFVVADSIDKFCESMVMLLSSKKMCDELGAATLGYLETFSVASFDKKISSVVSE